MFPTLTNTKFAPINLNDLAQQWHEQNDIQDHHLNPLLDPNICSEMIRAAHQNMETDFSHGGWLEPRHVLWRGSYLDEKETHIHLGIDINVPKGTPVAVNLDATVLRIDCDTPEEHGWGTRVIVQPHHAPVVLIYAHLSPAVRVQIGETIRANTIIGDVGAPENNGGWFPHLHVQAVTTPHYKELLKDDLRNLDGYGALNEQADLSTLFPDPSPWIQIH